MCGLAGIFRACADASDHRAISNMCAVLRHRGPDGAGEYFDTDTAGLALGHQRLSIIDPAHGQQPMSTRDGVLTIVFNGEIYNYLELRRDLIARGQPIESYSDTEVLLYAYREWGEACLDRLNGMFAFAIWDHRHRRS